MFLERIAGPRPSTSQRPRTPSRTTILTPHRVPPDLNRGDTALTLPGLLDSVDADPERQTREPGRQDGALGRNGPAVLRALLFRFLNYRTGQLDPSYEAIADQACISPRTVARGLKSLREAGLLNWLRRCTPIIETGRCVLEQLSNAYAPLPVSQWRGYRPSFKRAPPPAPHPDTCGAHSRLPDALAAAVIARRESGPGRAVLRELESDPTNPVAKALARLGRALGLAETPLFSDLPT